MKKNIFSNYSSEDNKQKALLIVEPNFLSTHVGVRRVILYYWKELLDAGFNVTLATPRDGELYLSELIDLYEILKLNKKSHEGDSPRWTSYLPILQPAPKITNYAESLLKWRSCKCLLDDYAISVITNPWLCTLGLPERKYTAGIVYDLIPNFLASGILSLDNPVNTNELARNHDIGNEFFLKYVENILCISESTKKDFLAFYGLSENKRIRVLIPFKVEFDARVKSTLDYHYDRPHVLLVNILDPRKNFLAVAAALKIISSQLDVHIDIVGQERMQIERVINFFEDLNRHESTINWFAGASDYCLSKLYADADLLIFPSSYEGLGLPIAEAQMHGVPTISSNVSSCLEINMNPDLCVDPNNHKELSEAIFSVIKNPSLYLRGKKLQERLDQFLKPFNYLPFIPLH